MGTGYLFSPSESHFNLTVTANEGGPFVLRFSESVGAPLVGGPEEAAPEEQPEGDEVKSIIKVVKKKIVMETNMFLKI